MGKLGRPTELYIADNVAEVAKLAIMTTNPAVKVFIGGSVRRRKLVVADVDLLVVTDVPSMSALVWSDAWHVTPKTAVSEFNDVRIEAWWCPPETVGPMLQFVTGPAKLNIALRTMAMKEGLKYSQYGVFDRDGARLDAHDDDPQQAEANVFACFGLPWVSPEHREHWMP